jgi:hypothetical protein
MCLPGRCPALLSVYRAPRQAGFWPVGIEVSSPANELLWSLDFVAQALLPALSGKNKYHAHAFQQCSKMPSIPLSSLSEPGGSRGPRQAGFWPVGIEVLSPANELLWSLDFVAQALLPVLSGHDKYHAHALQPCRKMPSIPLSSLSEPAGAKPEFARVGEPRASRKMIVGTSSMLIQCVLTSSLITSITSPRLIILIGLQPWCSALQR